MANTHEGRGASCSHGFVAIHVPVELVEQCKTSGWTICEELDLGGGDELIRLHRAILARGAKS